MKATKSNKASKNLSAFGMKQKATKNSGKAFKKSIHETLPRDPIKKDKAGIETAING